MQTSINSDGEFLSVAEQALILGGNFAKLSQTQKHAHTTYHGWTTNMQTTNLLNLFMTRHHQELFIFSLFIDMLPSRGRLYV